MNIVILAAGQGKRMHSNLPKVLHPIAGKALAQHVIDTARSLAPEKLVVVYGHGGEMVRSTLESADILWAKQEPQLGTGHAVAQAQPELSDAGQTLVLYGDVPLTKASTLKRLLQAGKDGLSVLTVNLANPTGYGRIVRDAAGRVQRIVEEKDAASEEKKISEVNTGIKSIPSEKPHSRMANGRSSALTAKFSWLNSSVCINAISLMPCWLVACVWLTQTGSMCVAN